MDGFSLTLGEILLFDAKLPPGLYIIWDNESPHPVFLEKTMMGCDERIVEQWQGGPGANRDLNAAMHDAEPYCLEWAVDVYPSFSVPN